MYAVPEALGGRKREGWRLSGAFHRARFESAMEVSPYRDGDL
jgi:hypothetical protein